MSRKKQQTDAQTAEQKENEEVSTAENQEQTDNEAAIQTKKETPVSYRYTKEELIEGAAALKAERFEIAGALFDCTQPLTLEEAKKRVEAYRKRTKKGV